MTPRQIALNIAKQGYSASIRRVQYSGTIGRHHYCVNVDDRTVSVKTTDGFSSWAFNIRKSWAA